MFFEMLTDAAHDAFSAQLERLRKKSADTSPDGTKHRRPTT
jgi:hypothetical protein